MRRRGVEGRRRGKSPVRGTLRWSCLGGRKGLATQTLGARPVRSSRFSTGPFAPTSDQGRGLVDQGLGLGMRLMSASLEGVQIRSDLCSGQEMDGRKVRYEERRRTRCACCSVPAGISIGISLANILYSRSSFVWRHCFCGVIDSHCSEDRCCRHVSTPTAHSQLQPWCLRGPPAKKPGSVTRQ